jgi:glycosyltransferase involved in cell wall biosynthesis
MNQLAYHKGADIFLKVAAAMPDLRFRVVGTRGWLPVVDIPANVEVTGSIDSMGIYQNTSVFIAPSRINETFGRCVVEAQLNGIPVIASDRGGPKHDQLVPKELRIEEIDDIDRWVERLRWVLEHYELASKQAAERDFSFCALEPNVATFLRIVRTLYANRSSSTPPSPDEPGVTLS